MDIEDSEVFKRKFDQVLRYIRQLKNELAQNRIDTTRFNNAVLTMTENLVNNLLSIIAEIDNDLTNLENQYVEASKENHKIIADFETKMNNTKNTLRLSGHGQHFIDSIDKDIFNHKKDQEKKLQQKYRRLNKEINKLSESKEKYEVKIRKVQEIEQKTLIYPNSGIEEGYEETKNEGIEETKEEGELQEFKESETTPTLPILNPDLIYYNDINSAQAPQPRDRRYNFRSQPVEQYTLDDNDTYPPEQQFQLDDINTPIAQAPQPQDRRYNFRSQPVAQYTLDDNVTYPPEQQFQLDDIDTPTALAPQPQDRRYNLRSQPVAQYKLDDNVTYPPEQQFQLDDIDTHTALAPQPSRNNIRRKSVAQQPEPFINQTDIPQLQYYDNVAPTVLERPSRRTMYRRPVDPKPYVKESETDEPGIQEFQYFHNAPEPLTPQLYTNPDNYRAEVPPHPVVINAASATQQNKSSTANRPSTATRNNLGPTLGTRPIQSTLQPNTSPNRPIQRRPTSYYPQPTPYNRTLNPTPLRTQRNDKKPWRFGKSYNEKKHTFPYKHFLYLLTKSKNRYVL